MPGRLPKAILFDMDDTILKDSGNESECWLSACRSHCLPSEHPSPEALEAAIRAHRRWYWSDPERHRLGRLDLERAREEIVAAALLQLGVDAPALPEAIAQTYGALRDAAIRPFPGALETLHVLRERGLRLALITNGSSRLQRRKIEVHGLAPLFDYILIEGEFGAGKPDESVYLHALSQLGVLPSQAWMVGDNLEWEVVAPQRLGIFALWHDVAGTGLPAATTTRPDRIILALSELIELLSS
jgi:putative hydrolase of the HAD superfamily